MGAEVEIQPVVALYINDQLRKVQIQLMANVELELRELLSSLELREWAAAGLWVSEVRFVDASGPSLCYEVRMQRLFALDVPSLERIAGEYSRQCKSRGSLYIVKPRQQGAVEGIYTLTGPSDVKVQGTLADIASAISKGDVR